MESAKSTLSLTKYFVSLPSSGKLAGIILLLSIFLGALLGVAKEGNFAPFTLLGGAGTALSIVALPAFLSAGMLSMLRKKVGLRRALAVAAISSSIYLFFYVAAVFASSFHSWGANLIFVGIGLALIAWFSILRFAFGLEKSAWLFCGMQLFLHSAFLLAGSSVALGQQPAGMAARIGLSVFVFLAAMGGLLFLASAPLKKNLGLTSSDALSMFLSQWIYGEKDLEDAFEEIGEEAHTLVGVCGIKTSKGTCNLVVPYVHFGPFGNLGGSQFSHQLASALKKDAKTTVIVFHGTATHDFDPVSTSQIGAVIEACQKALSSLSHKEAKWRYSHGKAGDSSCHLFNVNNDAFVSFTRAPLSTEDVNFAVGWALMQQAEKRFGIAIAADCHNAETGDVDYVEPGSKIAFEMSDALSKAMAPILQKKKMLAGWAECQAHDVNAIGSGGIKLLVLADDGKGKNLNAHAICVIDGNGITGYARDRLISSLESFGGKKGYGMRAEIFTTDTHQMNNVRGVFNPVGAGGEDDYLALETHALALCASAMSSLSMAKFGCAKERLVLKVLGPYQSAEIVSTLNSVVAILKIAMPLVLIASVAFLLWALSKI